MYEENPNKEKRIAFLSVFSSLCRTGQVDTKTTKAVVDNLFKSYPLEEKQTKQTYKPKSMKEEECAKCGAPLKYREGVKKEAGKPDKPWRGQFCQNRECKNVIWMPHRDTQDNANHQDSIEDEAHNQPPSEYGG